MSTELVSGVFDSAARLLRAAREARERGWSVHEAYTPYPVHGLDEALGAAPSKLPFACLVFGVAGLALGFGFQEWVNLVDWPMNVGGKPFNAWPAFIPVSFELTVLFAGVGSVFTFLAWRGLQPLRQPEAPGLRVSDDRFVLVLRAPRERKAAAAAFLKDQGGKLP